MSVIISITARERSEHLEVTLINLHQGFIERFAVVSDGISNCSSEVTGLPFLNAVDAGKHIQKCIGSIGYCIDGYTLEKVRELVSKDNLVRISPILPVEDLVRSSYQSVLRGLCDEYSAGHMSAEDLRQSINQLGIQALSLKL